LLRNPVEAWLKELQTLERLKRPDYDGHQDRRAEDGAQSGHESHSQSQSPVGLNRDEPIESSVCCLQVAHKILNTFLIIDWGFFHHVSMFRNRARMSTTASAKTLTSIGMTLKTKTRSA
jgi:hypothetical protein